VSGYHLPDDDSPLVDEFLSGLELRSFDLGGLPTAGGRSPWEEYPAAVV
jgi:hypothetical protein